MTDDICCPHCGGSGRVPEDHLTDGHISVVFADWCEVFGVHRAYGVQRWEDEGGEDTVTVVQDTSAMSCPDTETHHLPRAYFTRDRERRLALMRADKAKAAAEAAERSRADMARRLAEHERQAAAIRQTLAS